jgi:hypothetical protein
VANSVLAAAPARCRSTARRGPSARAPGNTPLECFAAVAERLGIRTGLDVLEMIDVAEDVVRPVMDGECVKDRLALIMGYAGVYSSFLKHAYRAPSATTCAEPTSSSSGPAEAGRRPGRTRSSRSPRRWPRAGMSGAGFTDPDAADDVIGTSDDLLAAAVRTARRRPPDRGSPRPVVGGRYRSRPPAVARRVAAGERVIGAKLGLTARAKQEQMKVSEPVYGRLLSGGVHPGPTRSSWRSSSTPASSRDRVRDGRGRPRARGDRVRGARRDAAVCCGLEIIDSRYADFSFTAADVVADNTSAARIVLGPTLVDPAGLDLALIGCSWRSTARRWRRPPAPPPWGTRRGRCHARQLARERGEAILPDGSCSRVA